MARHRYTHYENVKDIQVHPEVGPLVTGGWRRQQRVWSARQERIQIKYGKGVLKRRLIMKVLPSLPTRKPPI